MRHLHDELLAGLALGEPDRLGLRDRAHLLLCRSCRDRLRELRRLVATGRGAPPYALQAPRPGLLTAIQAELAADPADRPAEPAVVPGPDQAAVRPPRRVARYGPRVLAAAVVVVLAVGGVVWYRQGDDVVVVARATLTPLPDKSGAGTAELVRRDGVPQLQISVTAPLPADRYEELWLINTDGRQMISLGIVPPDGRASYPVPAASGALDGYTIVDISLEPFDGNALHSRNSLLRGTLDP